MSENPADLDGPDMDGHVWANICGPELRLDADKRDFAREALE